jgi:hypothetical protein
MRIANKINKQSAIDNNSRKKWKQTITRVYVNLESEYS